MSSDEPLYRSLLEVLKEPANSQDHVVFSGDIFDLLVGGSPYFKHKFSEVWTSIDRLLKSGVKVDYIPGNHDFHLEKLLPKGVTLHDDAVVVLDTSFQPEKRIYIAHGDLVDATDISYLRLRSFFRSKVLQFLCNHAPGTLIEKIGQSLSREPTSKQADLPENWENHQREGLRQVYRSFAEQKVRQGFDYVVLGHCHDLDEMKPHYFNMGYPPVHRQFLYYESGLGLEKELLKRRNFPGI